MSDCLFCKIIDKKIPAKVEYEDAETIAIQDINPQAPVHILFMPKRHIADISSMKGEDYLLLGKVMDQARKMAAQKGWEHYRLVFNNGAESGQSVFHIHLHLLSGRRMHWPPG